MRLPILLLTAFLLTFFPSRKNYLFADEIANPHWTGTHCTECHTSEKGKVLRFNGDIIEVCNRCHATEFASADIHPVNVELLDYMKQKISPGWPLQEGKVTCLTCHQVVIQMRENEPLKLVNPKFLRGYPYESINDICFSCHQREHYQKTNPHQQLDAVGAIIKGRCLFCHQSLPDPQRAQNIEAVSFKNERATLCVSCHLDKDHSHPARANHLVALPDTMKEQLQAQASIKNAYLPLYKGTIFCGTCHNPHQKGVIQRNEAAAGAGEKFLLRLSGGKELCITCHYDKDSPQQIKTKMQRTKVFPLDVQEVSVQHKPSQEQKCKVCHAITADKRDKPETLFLCFKEGCHKTEIIKNTFVHQESVLKNCTFCHSPHSSGYAKLLIHDEIHLCSICHPLVRDKNGKAFKKDHAEFSSYVITLGLPSGNECSLCHSPEHKKWIEAIGPAFCAECHLYIRQTASQNIHCEFDEKTCSACHDPHTSPYPYQLKEPPETYTQ